MEILREHIVDSSDRFERVTLSSFASALEKFGPICGPGPTQIMWAAQLIRSVAFHGAIERDEVERRLAGRPAGCFLIRFGGKPEHPFTIRFEQSLTYPFVYSFVYSTVIDLF